MTKQPLITALNKQTDGTIELTITIPQKRVKQAYQKILTDLAKETAVKGFRKGKAPVSLVEKKLGKQKIYEQTLKEFIPVVYAEAVEQENLKPIISPKIKVVSLEENKDWQIIATTCEWPEVKLKNYRAEIKKALATEKIWVPGKDKEEKPTPEKESQKLDKIFKALLATVDVKVPQIIVEDEVNRMLSRLVDQTNQLGLTVEQYLTSKGKTSEQLREEYKKQAKQTLKLEFTLSAIADKEKVEIKETEVEKMIQAVPDAKTKKTLDTPAQRAYIRQLLRKRAAIDKLAKL